MAESGGDPPGQSRRFTWNLRNMPNVNLAAPARIRSNIGRMVNDLLQNPDIQQEFLMNPNLNINVNTQQQQQQQQQHHHGQHGHTHNHPPHHHHHHAHNHGHQAHPAGPGNAAGQHTPLNFAPANIGGAQPPSQSFVINLGGGQGQGQANLPDENQNVTGDPGQSASAIHIQNVMKWMSSSAPFLLLLFAKILYDHRLGILVFLGLSGTFFHANSNIKKHVAQRENLSDTGLLWILVFLSANIAILYYVFDEQHLYKSLYLCLPEVGHIDVWNLLWVVGLNNFIIKFLTMMLKALVAITPRFILPHKRKGKFYMLLEYLSQFYLGLVPVTPWVYFLLDDEHGGQWFSVFLLGIYTVCKGQQVFSKAKDVREAFGKFKLDVSYGSSASNADIESADNTCPICQDKLSDPVKLTCNHIFCEDCVSMWFDRERTCPMCRANIVDNPIWRDGSTSASLQIY